MALLEYLNLTIPDLVKNYVPSFENRDPLLKQMRATGQVRRAGGSQVRIRRVKGRHSDAVRIDGSNITVPLNKVDTFSYMTADWGKIIIPIILPHTDRDRLNSKDEIKRWSSETVKAALGAHYIYLSRRLYTGAVNNSAYRVFGSLNGQSSNGVISGFTRGALEFLTPAAQAAAAHQYLNEARTQDTTWYTDNWFNQYGQHGGIGTDLLETVETIKLTADTYAMDGQGISIGALSIADHVLLGKEVRTYPGAGGVSAISYTLDDVEKGRTHPTIHIAGGVHYYSNRWINDTDMGMTQPVLLLNPAGCEYWVNAGNDHRMTKFTDHLETSNQDADVAYCVIECQFAVPNLLINGCASQ